MTQSTDKPYPPVPDFKLQTPSVHLLRVPHDVAGSVRSTAVTVAGGPRRPYLTGGDREPRHTGVLTVNGSTIRRWCWRPVESRAAECHRVARHSHTGSNAWRHAFLEDALLSHVVALLRFTLLSSKLHLLVLRVMNPKGLDPPRKQASQPGHYGIVTRGQGDRPVPDCFTGFGRLSLPRGARGMTPPGYLTAPGGCSSCPSARV
jgi:hypothetical protein